MTNNTSKSQHLYPFGEIDCWFVKYPHLTFKPSSTTHSIFYMEISVHILPISWTSFVFLKPPSFSLSRYSQGGYMSEVRPPTQALSGNSGLGLTFHLWAIVQTLYRECTTCPRLALRGTSATFHQLPCNATLSSKSKVCYKI